MTARRPTPKATPENTTANRVLHYAGLTALLVVIAIIALAIL